MFDLNISGDKFEFLQLESSFQFTWLFKINKSKCVKNNHETICFRLHKTLSLRQNEPSLWQIKYREVKFIWKI